jgi:hypothetical protein
MEEVDNTDTRTTRTSFLKRVGATLAVAVGVAGAMASRAFAVPGQCCYDCSCGDCDDQSPENKCWCRCDCFGDNYCWYDPRNACIEPAHCVSCPC